MNSYSRLGYLPAQELERKPNKKKVFRPGRKVPTIFAVFLLFYLLISFFTHFHKLYTMQNDIKEIQIQVQELSQKNDYLREQLRQAQSDAYVEKVAREKLGLVMPGESKIMPSPKENEKTN